MFFTDMRREVLVTGAVLEVQQSAPDEVCGETAEQHHDEFWQASPIRRSSCCRRGFCNGIASCKRKRETRAHDAGECCDHDAFLEIEFLDKFFLFLFRHFIFLGQPRQRGHTDADQANQYAKQRHLPWTCGGDLSDGLCHGNRRRHDLEDWRQ